MSLSKDFSKRLNRLWERRTAELRAAVIPRGRGAAPKFTRPVRERILKELLDTASEILVGRDAKHEFQQITIRRRLLHIRGRGIVRRGDNLSWWVSEKLEGPIVYSFWSGSRCLYVGKGIKPNRLYDYERSAYLLEADCVVVFSIKSRSYLGQAECLATHLYSPRDQKVKPARVLWGKKCPICEKHDFIRAELEGLFRMR